LETASLAISHSPSFKAYNPSLNESKSEKNFIVVEKPSTLGQTTRDEKTVVYFNESQDLMQMSFAN
jgi:hypothetical protein